MDAGTEAAEKEACSGGMIRIDKGCSREACDEICRMVNGLNSFHFIGAL